MQTKTVYSYDNDYKYIGEKVLDNTDKDTFGNFNIPGNCVEVEPLASKAGFEIVWSGKEWEYKKIPQPEPKPELTLDELKQQKIQDFKFRRDNEEVAVLEYNSKTFDYDDKARERMRIAEKALVDNNLASQPWMCADNSQTELTIQDFKNINSLAAQRSGTLHIKYNELKEAVSTCTTAEELKQVIW